MRQVLVLVRKVIVFRPGDRVKTVHDDTQCGTIASSEMTYKVVWDDGTQTYMVRESAIAHAEGN